MSKQTKRRWLNRLIFVLVVAAGIGIYFIYINSANIYDFTLLTRRMNVGEGTSFVPLSDAGGGRVPGMVRAAETRYIALYINMEDTTFAVHDKRNNAVWYSSPQGPDHIANDFNRGLMMSNLGFSYYNQARARRNRWLYHDSVAHGTENFEITSIAHEGKVGIRITYNVGDLDLGLHAIPRYIPEELFHELHEAVLAENPELARFFRQQWMESEEREGFRRLSEGIFGNVVNTSRMLSVFNELGWDLERTMEYNAKAGYEPDISFDFWSIPLELLIVDDRLYANVPLDRVTNTSEYVLLISNVDLLRFFGAGCAESEGFMLVPSGSGALINFNNGKYREAQFSAPIYGEDNIMVDFFPQMIQSVRLPVIGIKNNGFGMIAHIQNGQALGHVNSEVAGRTAGVGAVNAQNNVWFNFHIRSSMPLGMGGVPGTGGNLRVIQEEGYDGDLTVVYQFIAAHNPGVADMAQAYQQFLVSEGVLTPLDGPGDRTFYLDILGALDVRRLFLGVPYNTLHTMTNLEDANRFVDILNNGGISNIQMQLHGWFNRGINHDVANRVRPIRSVGTQREMQQLESRLQQDGGGLNPVVNFHLTNYYSRRFQRALGSARNPAGYIGFLSTVERDVLSTLASIHMNDWFVLVHPGVVPQHVDRFIPAFERRVGLSGLAVSDMGDILTESSHRRNPIDREHSRLVAERQLGRLAEMAPNLVVFGGNDYSLRYAAHVVDAPTETDLFFVIDYEVPFFPMVLHGFIEFAGRPVNMREHFDPVGVLLNSMATGASPRYILTSAPTREAQFSPHERFYSTHYLNWMTIAISHYTWFNDVYRDLRGERIVGFDILAGRGTDIMTSQQVTVTTFSNGTRIYVNNTSHTFYHEGMEIPHRWFKVVEGSGA